MCEDPAQYGLPSVASQEQGDKRIGVIWHTQGSGKSLLMAFYARQIIARPAMENPTVVVVTDRNDLDDQVVPAAEEDEFARRWLSRGNARAVPACRATCRLQVILVAFPISGASTSVS